MGLPDAASGSGPAGLMPPLHPAHHAAYLAAARSFDNSSQMRISGVSNSMSSTGANVSKT